ncbi:hypothetical protein [Sphingomonas sp. PB4P5]|uniref:hypothetical protein n=1 Tax=Parasphingomonas puruogangriensis TaxID=3096155 RepID=UPI002FCAAD61
MQRAAQSVARARRSDERATTACFATVGIEYFGHIGLTIINRFCFLPMLDKVKWSSAVA